MDKIVSNVLKQRRASVIDGKLTHWNWVCLIDGSLASQKAFEICTSCLHSEDEQADNLRCINVFDPSVQNQLPFTQRSFSIARQYEDLCFSAKLKHDRNAITGLNYGVEAMPYLELKSKASEITDFSKRAHVQETITSILQTQKPDYLFLGSFGSGGKEDSFGSVIGNVLANANTTTFVIKHWAPVPDNVKGAVWVLGIDGSKVSHKAMFELKRLVRPEDKVYVYHILKSQDVDNAQLIVDSCRKYFEGSEFQCLVQLIRPSIEDITSTGAKPGKIDP